MTVYQAPFLALRTSRWVKQRQLPVLGNWRFHAWMRSWRCWSPDLFRALPSTPTKLKPSHFTPTPRGKVNLGHIYCMWPNTMHILSVTHIISWISTTPFEGHPLIALACGWGNQGTYRVAQAGKLQSQYLNLGHLTAESQWWSLSHSTVLI